MDPVREVLLKRIYGNLNLIGPVADDDDDDVLLEFWTRAQKEEN